MYKRETNNKNTQSSLSSSNSGSSSKSDSNKVKGMFKVYFSYFESHY